MMHNTMQEEGQDARSSKAVWMQALCRKSEEWGRCLGAKTMVANCDIVSRDASCVHVHTEQSCARATMHLHDLSSIEHMSYTNYIGSRDTAEASEPVAIPRGKGGKESHVTSNNATHSPEYLCSPDDLLQARNMYTREPRETPPSASVSPPLVSQKISVRAQPSSTHTHRATLHSAQLFIIVRSCHRESDMFGQWIFWNTQWPWQSVDGSGQSRQRAWRPSRILRYIPMVSTNRSCRNDTGR